MLCLYPVAQDQTVHGTRFIFQRRCGYCETCVIHKAAGWSARIQLEALSHAETCFLTLTYNEQHYPENGSLNKSHLQNFLKRLRINLDRDPFYRGTRIRYFACGEYGDRTGRPHYHLVIFGLGANSYVESLLQKSWCEDGDQIGHIKLDVFNAERASYVARYVTKKMRKASELPPDCIKEFSLMSRRPGVGMGYAQRIAKAIMDADKSWSTLKDIKDGDPILNIWRGYLHVNGRFYPAARYLRQKIMELVEQFGGTLKSKLRSAAELERKMVTDYRSGQDLVYQQLREAHARKARRMLSKEGKL